MTAEERKYLARITDAINDTDIHYLTIPMLKQWKGNLYLALLELFDGCNLTDYVEELERIEKL